MKKKTRDENMTKQSCNAMHSTHSTQSTIILIDYAKATVLT